MKSCKSYFFEENWDGHRSRLTTSTIADKKLDYTFSYCLNAFEKNGSTGVFIESKNPLGRKELIFVSHNKKFISALEKETFY